MTRQHARCPGELGRFTRPLVTRPRSSTQDLANSSAVVQRMLGMQDLADDYSSRSSAGELGRLRDAVSELSGQRLDDVAIHEDSPVPEDHGARALATDDAVHLGPGQGGAAGHELWHVAQQRAGRVSATGTLETGPKVNTDSSLEREADQMGAEAQQLARRGEGGRGGRRSGPSSSPSAPAKSSAPVVQGLFTKDQAKAEVSVWGKSRSAAYKAILDEFAFWHDHVAAEGATVKFDFLTQLLARIREYLESKEAKQTTTKRSTRITNMKKLETNIEQELESVRQDAGATQTSKIAYVGGGQQALDEDDEMGYGFSKKFHGPVEDFDKHLPGEQTLDNLGVSPTVHVFGHGNLGSGIGSKKHNMSAQQVVDSLVADKLPTDKHVIVKLYACGTGAAPQRGREITQTQPAFVERVAKAMAEAGFVNATVIGYTVFMKIIKDSDLVMRGRETYHKDTPIHSDPSNLHGLDDREVVWVVRDGEAKQSSGGQWTLKNTRETRYEIRRKT